MLSDLDCYCAPIGTTTAMSSKPSLTNHLLPVVAFDCNQVFSELVIKVARNPALVKLVESSFVSKERDELANSLRNLLPAECHGIIKDPWVGFTTYCK